MQISIMNISQMVKDGANITIANTGRHILPFDWYIFMFHPGPF